MRGVACDNILDVAHRHCDMWNDGIRCRYDAKFSMTLRVWSIGTNEESLLKLDNALCTEHAQNIKLRDVLTREEWDDICTQIVQDGKELPSLGTAQLEIECLGPYLLSETLN